MPPAPCSCNDGVSNQANCNGTYFDYAVTNMTQDQAWTNLYPNFDNLGNALIVLFITTTTNGYSPYMIAAMNSPNLKVCDTVLVMLSIPSCDGSDGVMYPLSSEVTAEGLSHSIMQCLWCAGGWVHTWVLGMLKSGNEFHVRNSRLTCNRECFPSPSWSIWLRVNRMQASAFLIDTAVFWSDTLHSLLNILASTLNPEPLKPCPPPLPAMTCLAG